jgi:uncharacterized protein (TIGR03643 family)
MMQLNKGEESRIIEMAWEDRTSFEAIKHQFNLTEQAVIQLMHQHLKASRFKLWPSRVAARKTKQIKLRSPDIIRGYCPTQYKHR